MSFRLINPQNRDFALAVKSKAESLAKSLYEQKKALEIHAMYAKRELLRKQLLICYFSAQNKALTAELGYLSSYNVASAEPTSDFGYYIYFGSTLDCLQSKAQKIYFQQIDERILEVARLKIACAVLDGVLAKPAKLETVSDLISFVY